MKLLRRFILLFIFLILLPVGLASYLFFTNSGAKLIVSTATRFLPGQINITQISGNFQQGFIIDGLNYNMPGLKIYCRHLNFKILLSQLYQRKLHITQLNADNLSISYDSTQQPNNDKTSFDFLSYLNVETVTINKMSLTVNKNALTIDELNFQADAQNKLNKLTIRSRQGIINATIRVENQNPFIFSSQIEGKEITPDLAKLDKMQFSLAVKGNLGVDNPDVDVAISSLQGTYQNQPVNGTGSFYYSNNKITISNLLLQLGNASLAVSGDLGDFSKAIQWNLTIPDMSKLNESLHGSLRSSGRYDFINKQPPKITAFVNASKLRISDLAINDLKMEMKTNKQAIYLSQLLLDKISYQHYAIDQLTVRVQSTLLNSLLTMNYQVTNYLSNNISGELKLPLKQQSLLDGPINATLKFGVNEPSKLIHLPNAKIIGGQANGKLTVTGSFKNPRIIGQAAVSQLSLNFPQLGSTLENINIKFLLNKDSIDLDGGLMAGKGSAKLTGDYNLLTTAGKLNITGNNLSIINLPEATVSVSPDVAASLQNNVVNINGKIDLPYVRVKTLDYNNIVSLPAETIIVGRKQSSIPITTTMNLLLTTGDVSIQSDKLNASVGGSIRISQIPGGLPLGIGELTIKRGTYDLYGKLLSIRNGRIIYTGNLLSNPGLNIKAVKTINTSVAASQGVTSSSARINNLGTVQVGAMIQGTLKRPKTILFSQPSMQQNDMLSYLIFGSPQNQLSILNSIELIRILSDKVGQPSNAKSTPTLFNKLSSGLFSAGSFLNYRFPLMKHWVIQTQASFTDTGADLIYEREF